MPQLTNVAGTGLIPCSGGAQQNVAIDGVTALVLPTANYAPEGGALVCIICLETAAARWSWSIQPSAVAGMLTGTPTAEAPIFITLEGIEQIRTFRIIGAGATISYEFLQTDIPRGTPGPSQSGT